MIRKTYLVRRKGVLNPVRDKGALTSCCSHPTLWTFNFKIWNSETRLVGYGSSFPESSVELDKLPKASFTGSSTHVKGRHTRAKKYIMCQDVFHSSFLRLSQQILSSKAWVFSEASSTGGRSGWLGHKWAHTASLGKHVMMWEGGDLPFHGPRFWSLLTILLS